MKVFAYFEFYGSNVSQNSGWRQQKAERESKKQLEEHFETGQVNWLQISNMTGYKKRILKRQSFSEVKTGRGSPISKINKWKLYKLRNNFRVMVLNVKMWRLRVFHHLQSIKLSRDSEHLEKSKRQSWKFVFCIKNHFQKSSSVNTVSFTEVKALMQRKRRMWRWSRNAAVFLKETELKWKTVLCSDESKFSLWRTWTPLSPD